MSTQFKLDQTSKLDNNETNPSDKNANVRPNIDNLLKRIIEERRQEKKNSLIMLSIAILGICVASFVFTQA
jgi:hypothetical protein|tara:strand:+ start:170 stop:382 length:213 start_codon:yes stop_codon:yes gene_type:complete